MGMQVTITLRHRDLADTRVGMCMTLSPSDGGVQQALDIDRASGYADLSAAETQVLRSEIGAGILTALKQAGSRDWRIELQRFWASIAGEEAMRRVPSDGFAVAAVLCVLHGSLTEDLEARPHGGYAWLFDSIAVETF